MTDNDKKAIRDFLAHWAAAQCIRAVVASIAAGFALWQGRGVAVALLVFLLFWIWFGLLVPRQSVELDAMRKRLGD